MRAAWWLLAAALTATGCTRGPAAPVRFGHIAALSGPDKEFGEHSRRGVELAVAEVMAGEGRLLGRPLVVHHADHRGDAETLQAEAVRLLAVVRVAALIADCDAAAGAALSRVAQPYGVPVVLTRELAAPPRPGTWVLGAGPEARGAALARFSRQQLKAARVAVLASGGELPETLVGAFRREWVKEPSASLERWPAEGSAALAEAASRVADGQADAVLVAGEPGDVLRVGRRLEAASLKAPLLYGGPDLGPEPFRGQSVSVYLATAFAAAGLTEPGKEFARRYEEAYHEPADLAAAQGYDATRLLVAAARAADAARVRPVEALDKGVPFDTVTGPLSFAGRQALRPVFVFQVKAGRPVLVDTAPAAGG